MRKPLMVLIVIFLTLYIGSRYLGHSTKWDVVNMPPANPTIAAFGDSITFGAGANKEESYPSVLGELLKVPIINAGRNGDTTRDALNRVEDVMKEKPGTVIVMLGGNDLIHRISLQETLENLTKIITRFQEEGIVVAMFALNPPGVGDNWQMAIEHLCKEKGVFYMGHVMNGLWGNHELMADTIHPNKKGYALIAERIAAALKEVKLASP